MIWSFPGVNVGEIQAEMNNNKCHYLFNKNKAEMKCGEN